MTPRGWINFAIVVGGASGALTGLLFVAVSLSIQKLVERPTLRASAAQTLIVFILPLLVAILLATPGQLPWSVGVELTVLGIFAGVAMATIGRRKQTAEREEEARLSRMLGRTSPNLLTSLLITVAGVSVLTHVGGGLYWLVPATMTALAGGVANTWLFLTRLPS